LDPDGLNVQWSVIRECGSTKQIEVLLNFSTMGMNLNAALRDPAKIKAEYARNMNQQWGDDSWKEVAYSEVKSSLFPDEEGYLQKAKNDSIMMAFKGRLKTKGGFAFISDPVPFVDPRANAAIYYLFFASPKEVGVNIFNDIIKKIDRDGPDFWKVDNSNPLVSEDS
jgi:three-Cys-motif partner protein